MYQALKHLKRGFVEAYYNSVKKGKLLDEYLYLVSRGRIYKTNVSSLRKQEGNMQILVLAVTPWYI